MKKSLYVIFPSIVVILILFAAGYRHRRVMNSQHTPEENVTEKRAEYDKTGKKILFWTCAMHPQIHLPEPGQCPICFMNLIPVYENISKEDTSRVTLTETGRNLAGIETAPVVYRELSVEINLYGEINYDETKTASISARFPGRVDKLYVNFTGVPVEKGAPLFKIYSPELRTAQQEYLIAMERYTGALERKDEQEIPSGRQLRESARKKLELWGILPEQIKELETKGEPSDAMDYCSPASGVVIEKNALEGKYFNTGEILFRIADLNTLWIQLQAYEKDFRHIHIGQTAKIAMEAYPEETFEGKVVFADPFVDEATRTGRIRIEIANAGNKLKPGMFCRAVIREDIGRTLSIPYTAPLITGKRAVVYVETKPDVFEAREVTLGTRAGDFYPVVSGLKAGEKIVTRGNFKLDASLQIKGEPGMMKLMEDETGETAAPSAAIRHRH